MFSYNFPVVTQAADYEKDDATEAIGQVFLDFKTKCEQYQQEQDPELLVMPVLPTSEALLAILGKLILNYSNLLQI